MTQKIIQDNKTWYMINVQKLKHSGNNVLVLLPI